MFLPLVRQHVHDGFSGKNAIVCDRGGARVFPHMLVKVKTRGDRTKPGRLHELRFPLALTREPLANAFPKRRDRRCLRTVLPRRHVPAEAR